MDKLSHNEVLHVAELGRLELTEEEIEKFSYQLKALFKEIDKINEIKLESDDILISPTSSSCTCFKDEPNNCTYNKSLIENAPSRFDEYIEIRGVLNE